MLSYETRNRLADTLLGISDGERQIEIVRQILCEQVDFEPYAAFKRIDRPRKGALDALDVVRFLEDNKVHYSENNCQAFIRRYDADNDGLLTYNEFLSAVLPQDNPTLRTIAAQRPNYDVAEDQLLSYDVEYSLAKVIDREISFYLDLDYKKISLQNCYDFNYLDAFAAIDRYSTGKIDFVNLDEFFRRQGIYPNQDEIIALLRRFDRDDDGLLNYDEFARGLEPVDSLLKASINKTRPSIGHGSPLKSRVYSPSRKQISSTNRSETLNSLKKTSSPRRKVASPLRSTFMQRTASPIRTTSSFRKVASPSRTAAPSHRVVSPSRRVTSPSSTYQKRHSVDTRKVASPHTTYTRSPVRVLFQESKVSFAEPERIKSPAKLLESQHGFRSTASSIRAGGDALSPLGRRKSAAGFAGRSQASPLTRSQLGRTQSPSRHETLKQVAALDEEETYNRRLLKSLEKPILKKGGLYSSAVKSPVRTQAFVDRQETKRVHEFELTEAKEGLIDALKQFIHFEKELEISKQDLSLRPDFNLLDYFRVFDVEGRGAISSSELAEGMKRFNVYPNKEELYLFFRRFDKDNDGKLKFSDFTDAFICKQQEYATLLNNRTPINGDLSLELDQTFSEETKRAISRVLKMHLDNEGSTEALRQRLARRYNFNVHEAFSYLDLAEDGVISIDELGNILDKNDFYATQRELKLLMDRLDINRDGKITYSEFVQEMTPKSEKAF